MATNYHIRNFYVVDCKIGKLDLSKEIVGVNISCLLKNRFPIITLTFNLVQQILIDNDIFGKDLISLSIKLFKYNTNVAERYDLELIQLNADNLTIDNMSSMLLKDNNQINTRRNYTITCAPTLAFANMHKYVNYIFQEKTRCKPLDALKVICDAFEIKNKIDQNDFNGYYIPRTYLVDCIPFYSALGQMDLDFTGGFYKSPYISFHNFQEFYIQSSKYELNRSTPLTIYQAPGYGDIDKIYNLAQSRPKEIFYSVTPIKTLYDEPAMFAQLGGTITHTVKPMDTLYRSETLEMENIIEKYDVRTTQNAKWENSNKVLKNIKTYTDKYIGSSYNNIQISKRVIKQLAMHSALMINMQGMIEFENLLDVGKCINFKTSNIQYLKYEGKYLITGTNVTLQRQTSQEFLANANVVIARSNVTESTTTQN